MKKTNKSNALTPEQYIRQKSRTLPLGQCYMNKNWFISGIAIAVVCRCHKQGTYTFGVFQLDTFCSGLIDCKIEFSKDQAEYDNIIAYLKNSFRIEPVTYQEVHNLIYGGIGFGEDAGFTPPTIYNLGKYLLEEDTEDIPLINYQFGRFGKHFLLADSIQELDHFMPHLIAHLGKENIIFGIEGSDRYFEGEDFYDAETRQAMFQIASKMREQKETPLEEYSYAHPQYPTSLELKHELVKEVLYNPANRLCLPNEEVDKLLALPQEELKEDLQQILLYETGKACDVTPDVAVEEKESAFLHALILLGEVGDEKSLPVILETMCQKKEFYNYELGIILNEAYVPTLYKLGNNQLDKFFEYLLIPGLYTYTRYLIFPVLVQIAEQQPERKEEVIEFFRKALKFYAEHLTENFCCDGSLIGLIATDVLKLKGEELLPELKVLYETGLVNEQCCGNYDKLVEMMKQAKPFSIQYHFEAHERYADLSNGFNQIIEAHNNLIAEMKQNNESDNQTEEVTLISDEDTEIAEETPKKEEATSKASSKQATEDKVPAKKTTRAKKTTAAETKEKATKATKTTVKAAKGASESKVTKEPKASKETKAKKTTKESKAAKESKATKEPKTAKASTKESKK